jgi:predicted Ser/Thr protein kinase
MTPDQFQHVRTLFEEALDVDPADLRRWLDEHAADDPEVRAEVQALLEMSSRAGSFLAEPVAGKVSDLLEDIGGLEPGTTIGPYVVEREIGRGGMGQVYRARDTRLSRIVALKALPPRMTRDDAQRERLRREARAAAALTHPGICTVYALEEVDGQLFIASEYLEGRTLRDEISQPRNPTAQEVQATARELAEALASAHAAGIIHRDFKPENIMRLGDGRLKILDFGLARFDREDEITRHLTQAGTFIGTPAYMAPEQFTGERVDARADVFAFGLVMYEFACGVRPFQASSAVGQAAQVLQSEVPPILDRCPALPRQLADIIERCLRKAPADRFAAAGEIVAALTRLQASRRPSALPVWWRRHQLAVIGLYVLASAVAWWMKEWLHGLADSMFLVVGIASTAAAIFRGHLLFTERMNSSRFPPELKRARPVTLGLDLIIALALIVVGIVASQSRPLAAVLTIALAVGIALVNVIVEPATTGAAFTPAARAE